MIDERLTRLAHVAGEPAANPGVMLINVAGGGTWFPRMLEWADMQWQWRNPYTGACLAMSRTPWCASYRTLWQPRRNC